MNGRDVPVSVGAVVAATVVAVAACVDPALPLAAGVEPAAGSALASVDGMIDVVERIDAFLESILDLVRTIRALLGGGG